MFLFIQFFTGFIASNIDFSEMSLFSVCIVKYVGSNDTPLGCSITFLFKRF